MNAKIMKEADELWTRYALHGWRQVKEEGAIEDRASFSVWEMQEKEIMRTASFLTWDKVEYCRRELELVLRRLAAFTLPRFVLSAKDLSSLPSLRDLKCSAPTSAEEWLAVFASWAEELPICCTVADVAQPAAPIVYANAEFSRTTGYARRDVLGANLSRLQGPSTDREAVELLRRAMRDGCRAQVCLTNYRQTGAAFRNMVALNPVFDADRHYRFVVGMQFELDDAIQRPRTQMQISSTCFNLVRLGHSRNILPTTLSVPSVDPQAKRFLLRASLRADEMIVADKDSQRLSRSDSTSSDEVDEEEVFSERRAQTMDSDYDGPDDVVRSNGNVWISRCAWLLNWCSRAGAQSSFPDAVVEALSKADAAKNAFFELARVIDATVDEEVKVEAARREMMRSKRGVADGVLGTLFGNLQSTTAAPVETARRDTDAPRASYRDIVARFDDQVLAHLVVACPHVAAQSSFLQFRIEETRRLDRRPTRRATAAAEKPRRKSDMPGSLYAASPSANRATAASPRGPRRMSMLAPPSLAARTNEATRAASPAKPRRMSMLAPPSLAVCTNEATRAASPAKPRRMSMLAPPLPGFENVSLVDSTTAEKPRRISMLAPPSPAPDSSHMGSPMAEKPRRISVLAPPSPASGSSHAGSPTGSPTAAKPRRPSHPAVDRGGTARRADG